MATTLLTVFAGLALLLLMAVALLVRHIPARRAVKVDPKITLKYE